MFSSEMSIQVPCLFLISVCLFLCYWVKFFYILDIKALSDIWFCKYFLLFCRLSLHSVHCFLCYAECFFLVWCNPFGLILMLSVLWGSYVYEKLISKSNVMKLFLCFLLIVSWFRILHFNFTSFSVYLYINSEMRIQFLSTAWGKLVSTPIIKETHLSYCVFLVLC